MPSKLEKFADYSRFKNCFSFSFTELANGFFLKGKWLPDFFRNDHPLIVELGCGKGEYSVGLARHHQEKNFIGVDVKGNRMWTGASQALEEGLRNVAFLRTRI